MDAPRNLLLFSDGTGNRGGKTRGTNVWRLYNALDRHSPDVEQLALYDDGVGTRDSTLSAVLGGAFGWGLSRNLRQLYEFLVVNHREGDGVLLFGFGRGAFTVRCLGSCWPGWGSGASGCAPASTTPPGSPTRPRSGKSAPRPEPRRAERGRASRDPASSGDPRLGSAS